MRLMYLFMFVCLSISPVFAWDAFQGTHPFSVNDMLAMDRISDPQVSPDGKWIAFIDDTDTQDKNYKNKALAMNPHAIDYR